MDITRRHFIIRSAQLGATLLLPIGCSRNDGTAPLGASKLGIDERPEHFYLQVVPSFPAGWDSNYLFDARPLSMTAKGLIQNYLGKDPAPWKGRNGQQTLASPLVKPLEPYRDYFSVLNGVRMSQIDGHGQNFNFLFTGSALGGAGFIPRFNECLKQPYTLDAIQRGILIAAQNNTAGIVPLNVKLTQDLLKARPTEVSLLDPKDSLYRFVMSRFKALGGGDGAFSMGTTQMGSSMWSAPELARRIKQLNLPPAKEEKAKRPERPLEGPPPGDGTEIPFLDLACQLFRLRVCRAAILILDRYGFAFDCHAAENAKRQPEGYATIIDKMAQILKYLRETPFDSKRSFMDVTTFSFASEFGRTLRQEGRPIDDTGTDHNPLANSILVGGKGIRGGQVFGETDFRSHDEVLTPAHLSVDPGKLRFLGRPFDFTTMKPKAQPPADPTVEDYLNLSSVTNTLFSLMGVSSEYYWKPEGSSEVAPLLHGLLA